MASAISSKLIGTMAVLYLFSSAPLFVQAQHPSCLLQSGVILSCNQGGYILPNNFNTTGLAGQDHIQALSIAGNGNVGHDSPGLALPHLRKLHSIYLDNFNENTLAPFPLNSFLTNNKAQLESLMVFRVKLLTLTSSHLAGLHNLKTLALFQNDLTSIATDTFGSAGFLAESAMVPPPAPNFQITYLQISKNPRLTGLDWAVLAPLAGTLKGLTIHANGLETDKLVNSVDFKLNAVERVDLSGNRLTTISRAVFDSLTNVAGSQLSMSVPENQFCAKRPAGDCGCCELAGFADWVRQYGLTKSDLSFTCGAGHSANSQALFDDASLHQHCAKPPTGCKME